MEWSSIVSQWEVADIFKTICSLAAGIILGLERELKDKAAGLKTITIICLGSTLFTILSYKMGASSTEDATRIASYVVSGIGFLGAGVIFKDGLNVNGLTTASIIWVSAAIGMAIGFGEYFIALTFLISCYIMLNTGNYLTLKFFSSVSSKTLIIKLNKENLAKKDELLKLINTHVKFYELRHLKVMDGEIDLTLDITIYRKNMWKFEEMLQKIEYIRGFSY